MTDIVFNSPSQNLEKIVFFDFDGTLTTRDSLLPFLLFSIGILATTKAFFFSMGMLFSYLLKRVSNEDAKSFLLERAFKGRSINFLNMKGEAFSSVIKEKFEKEKMMNILESYKDEGCYCILVSASLDIYLKYWSANNGIDALLCSALQMNADGVVVGGATRAELLRSRESETDKGVSENASCFGGRRYSCFW